MKNKPSNQFRSYLGIAVAYTLLLLVLLLEPFNFFMPLRLKENRVRWLAATNGIELSSVGTIRSASTPKRLRDDLVSGTGMTLEVWISPESDQQTGPARIVSYSKDPVLRNFTLGQGKRHLNMRLRTTETDLDGSNPSLTAKEIFRSGQPQHIVVSYNFSEQNVYVDGQKRQGASIPEGRFANWNSSYPLVLGNEATGNRPWLGKLFLVAIYNRALSEAEIRKNYTAGRVFDSATVSSDDRVREGLVALYLFTEGKGDQILDQSGRVPPVDLHIPTKLWIVDKPFIFRFYAALRHLTLIDVVGNIIIFIPFGFLFHSAMRRRYQLSLKIAAVVFIFGALFTFSIESIQYFLEGRTSSMIDIINNIIGTVLGITIDKSGIIPIVMRRISAGLR